MCHCLTVFHVPITVKHVQASGGGSLDFRWLWDVDSELTSAQNSYVANSVSFVIQIHYLAASLSQPVLPVPSRLETVVKLSAKLVIETYLLNISIASESNVITRKIEHIGLIQTKCKTQQTVLIHPAPEELYGFAVRNTNSLQGRLQCGAWQRSPPTQPRTSHALLLHHTKKTAKIAKKIQSI